MLSDNAQKIFKKLYCFKDETIDEAFKRVATEFATNQTEYDTAFKFLGKGYWRPNTPAFLNAGTEHKVFSACYVVGLEDSMNSIYDVVNVARHIFQHGAGIGIPIGNLRESNANIFEGNRDKAPEGQSSGPVTFMKLFDAVGESTKSGGRVRRAAILCSLPVWHPDVIGFINCKEEDGRLANMNISVNMTDAFFESLRNNTPFELVSPDHARPIKEIDPQEIWNRLTDMAHKTADPGVIFIDTVNKYNPLIKDFLIECMNPCVVGDTLIATADGRNAVSIKQLAEEGRDVPVYSTNTNTSKVEIKMGRYPRVTGIKKEVWKLTLDDGSHFIATPDHKVLTKDGYIELKELKSGQSLIPFNSFLNHNYRNICDSGSKMKNYKRRNRRQYRLIHEFDFGPVDSKFYHIHHRDFNSFNDSPENLIIMNCNEHKKLHSERMKGKNNPYYKMSAEQRYRFAAKIGSDNPKYCNVTNSEIISAGKVLYEENDKITKNIWREFALDSRLTDVIFPVNLHQDFRFGSFQNFKDKVIGNHKVVSVEFYGYEDVYNITVDDNHNYHIINSFEDEKYITSSGICVKNCGEQPLIPFACCNLSAIHLHKFCKRNGEYDWDKLYRVSQKVMKLMDNVIDKMDFPDERFKENTLKYRQVGIGIMGLADALFELGLRYDGAEGRKFAADCMRTITTACVDVSADLAKKNGPFHNYDRYREDVERIIAEHTDNNEAVMAKVREFGVRNVQFTTAQPTGTTAISCDASYGIEPAMGLVFTKHLISGDIMVIPNPVFDTKFKKEKWYTDQLVEKIANNGGSLKGIHGIPKEVRDTFMVAHDIDYKARIEMQASLQKYCSTAISSTVNLPNDVTKEEVSDLFMYAYEKGLKGVTIYRDGSKRNQPVTFTKETTEFSRPNHLNSETYMVATGNGKMYVTITDDNGKPVEVFIFLGKSGQLLNTFTEGLGRVISLALQNDVPMKDICKTLMGINSDSIAYHRFENDDTKPEQILSIPDGIAKLLNKYYLNREISVTNGAERCKSCGTVMSATEGCFSCPACGESKCS